MSIKQQKNNPKEIRTIDELGRISLLKEQERL
jgi:hypothetical protein